MKKFLILLSMLFFGTAYAQTETLNWYIDGQTYATTTCESGNDILLPTTPTKRGYTFKGWSEYIPIEYLESTGTQWIDTGVKPSDYNGLQLYVDVVPIRSINTYYNMIFGAEFPRFYGPDFLPKGKIGWSWGGNLGETSTSFEWGTRYTFDVKAVSGDYNIIMDGVKIFESKSSVQYPSRNAYLFAANLNGTPNLLSVVKLYSFKLWNHDKSVLVRDFIPVLDKNGTPCMYDKVEKKFYYNAGTGDFIAGPVIGSGE